VRWFATAFMAKASGKQSLRALQIALGIFDMAVDKSFVERNRASTNRMRALAERLSDAELQQPVGKKWTVASTLAHIAFWDLRLLHVLDATERNNKLKAPEIDISVNDIALPLWKAVRPREAAQIAVETAETLDKRLENCPTALLEEIHARTERWVVRAVHRNAHLDAVEAALRC
jgi:uncharacterized damage-inducible protein DinB